MKKYQVFLSRTYIVDILAGNEEEACRNAEYYLGDCEDLSTKDERESDKFVIEKIVPSINEAFEVRETKEND
ncbi:MAG: hypothetical protein ACREOP_03590 [Thermodesulfobacteriota bacterium]